MFLKVEFGKILKKILLKKHFEPFVIFALLKGGGLCPAAAEHPFIVCAKKSGVSSFFNVTKYF